jgi:hypothetical protein
VALSKPSDATQGILAKGATEEARKNLHRLGSQKRGQPDAWVECEITAMTDQEKLDPLRDRM